jgi:epsilon-lactone hydrolase
MQRSTTAIGSTDFVVTHALDPEDASTVAAMRAMASATKGTLHGVTARRPF